ncbi:MAG: Ig-like domain-containing protein [Bacteroidales bacterium]
MKKVLLVLFAIIISLSIFSSCSEDENLSNKIELNSTSLSLKHNQTFQLQFSSDEGNIFTFKSSNPLVATVNESGLIKGGAKGETTITVTDNKGGKATCKVNVYTVYFLFKEPLLNFGCSKSAVKSYETRTIMAEETTSISYLGENANLAGLVYFFENSQFNHATLLVPIECTLLADFLLERYAAITYVDDTYGFLDPSKKIAVLLKLYNSDYWLVSYFEYTSTTQKSDIIKKIKEVNNQEKIFKAYNKILN